VDKETIRNHIWENNFLGIGKNNERGFNNLSKNFVPGGDPKETQRAGQKKAIEVCNSTLCNQQVLMALTDRCAQFPCGPREH
jgi:hypothetical protein